jgi:gluconate 2-dehydrogenase gamma chain
MIRNGFGRRKFLISSISVMAFSAGTAQAFDSSQWALAWNQMPAQVNPGPWTFFNPDEAAAIEALADRLIPSDDLSPGGKDIGVAVYIDAQLAGPFGQAAGLYMQPPFADGLPGQGPQSPLTPAERYRKTLAALADYCKSTYLGKNFADLPGAEQDKLISGMEAGTLNLPGVNSKAFFAVLWQNTKEGFFADPVYGGNRDMAAWKMIGFPGARYNYRDWIDKHNQPITVATVGLRDHPDWAQPNTQS